MKNKKQRSTFTQKEIAVALNNAMLAAAASTGSVGQTEERKRKLRIYTNELADLLYADVEDGFLRAEELVCVFIGAALFTHAARIMNTVKLPALEDHLKRTLEDEDGE